MTLLLAATTAAGAAACRPWLRSRIFAHRVGNGRPLRNHCPRCRTSVPTGWPSRPPATDRCPLCRRRIGPTAGTVELPAAATVAATLLTIAAATTSSWRQLLHAIGPIYLIITLIRPYSVGLGDGELAPTVSLILAWFHSAAAITGLIATVTIGIIAAAVLLITKRIRRNQAFAHGPVMPVGAFIAYLQIA